MAGSLSSGRQSRTRGTGVTSPKRVAIWLDVRRVPDCFVDHVHRLDVVAAADADTCGDQCSMVQ